MKKMINRSLVITLLAIASLPMFGTTLTVNQTFTAGTTTHWSIDVGDSVSVRIYYTKTTVGSGDILSVGHISGGTHETLSATSGTFLASYGDGVADICFYSSGAGTKAFQIDYYPETPALSTSTTLVVGGNATIGGSLTATSVNGKLATTSTSNSYLMGGLGIGVSSPSAKLHVYNSTTLGSTTGNYVPLTRTQGYANANFMANDFLVRDSTGSSWYTASYMKGISVGSSYLTPATIRSWIKQRPYKDLIEFGSAATTFMSIGTTVGIGTTTPDDTYKLDVCGWIHANGIIVDAEGTADYVFHKDYKLPELNEVEQFIQDNGHLPDMPSDTDVKENGLNVVDMQTKMLQKIEELTLYIIELQKEVESLKTSK